MIAYNRHTRVLKTRQKLSEGNICIIFCLAFYFYKFCSEKFIQKYFNF